MLAAAETTRRKWDVAFLSPPFLRSLNFIFDHSKDQTPGITVPQSPPWYFTNSSLDKKTWKNNKYKAEKGEHNC